MNDLPAALGGRPVFDRLFPVVRPVLPEFSALELELRSMLAGGIVTRGPWLAGFEGRAREYLGVKHAVAVSSCTTGLMLTLKCLEVSGEIIVPSFTFMATVAAVVWAGLTPVFCDVDAETTNLDPEAAAKALTPRTRAVLAVHNFGCPAATRELSELAAHRGLKLIYDAAHAFGSLCGERSVGGFGDAEAFSLSPTKLLIAGEGGLVTTDDDELARRLRIAREYGKSENYDSEMAGLNGRFAEFNALLAFKGLAHLEEHVAARNAYAAAYREGLAGVPGLAFQRVAPDCRSTYKDFAVMVDEKAFGLTRDELARAFKAENVDTRPYYDPPVHRHRAYARYHAGGGRLSRTEALSRTVLCLPIHSRMEAKEVAAVCRACLRIHRHAGDIRKAGRA